MAAIAWPARGWSVVTSTRAHSAYAERQWASPSSRSSSSAVRASSAQALASGVPRSTPTHARCARITRSSSGSDVRERSTAATRRARSAWRSPRDQQRVERGGLDRQPHVGIRLARELLLEHLRQAVVGGVDEVERREAREHVDPAVAVAHLAQRLAQPPARVRQSGVERHACRAARAASRGRRPVRPPRARARDRRRPPAAVRAARRSRRALQIRADLGIGLRPALHQVTRDQPAVRRDWRSARAPPRGAAARARSAGGPRRSRRRSGRARSAHRRRPAGRRPPVRRAPGRARRAAARPRRRRRAARRRRR